MSKQLVYQALLALLFPVYSKTRRTRPVFNRGADSIETSLSDKTENSILSKKMPPPKKLRRRSVGDRQRKLRVATLIFQDVSPPVLNTERRPYNEGIPECIPCGW